MTTSTMSNFHKDQLWASHAIQLAKTGAKTEAYPLLLDLHKKYPRDTTILLWIAFTAPDFKLAERALNLIEEIEPADPALANAWHWLAIQSEIEKTRPVAVSWPLPSKNTNKVSSASQTTNYPKTWLAVSVLIIGLVGLSLVLLFAPAAPGNVTPSSQSQESSVPKVTRPAVTPLPVVNQPVPTATASPTAIPTMTPTPVPTATPTQTPGPTAIPAPVLTLPVYNGATKIQLNPQARAWLDNLTAELDQSKSFQNSHYQGYVLKEKNLEDALNVYEAELNKQGYENTGEDDSDNVRVIVYANYSKKNYVVLETFSATIGKLSNFYSKIKSDEAILIVLTSEAKSTTISW